MFTSMDGAYVALKGYKYQFDKTILEILKNPSREICIEQVQDLGFDDYIIQVKHHDTVYSPSAIKAKKKKPLLQLLEEFKKDSSKQYVLYAYFNGIPPKVEKLSVSDLEEILGNDKANFSAKIRKGFVNAFTLVYAEDFAKQYDEVIEEIMKSYKKEKDECEVYYAIISSILLSIILQYPGDQKDKRVVTKHLIDDVIRRNKKIFFYSAYADHLGKERYLSFIKKTYVNSGLNINPYERFFVIESPQLVDLILFKEIILNIANKWGKTSKRATDPFVPYICIMQLDPLKLVKLKNMLASDGYSVKDGYDYLGAEFNPLSIVIKPTQENALKFKLLSDEMQLSLTLNAINKTKEVYQFFYTKPVEISQDVKNVKIEIKDFKDILSVI